MAVRGDAVVPRGPDRPQEARVTRSTGPDQAASAAADGGAPGPAIRLDGLRFAFPVGGQPVQVLGGIDLRVERGTVVALVGPNGCGKSTLLRVVAGLLPAAGGTVEVDGAPVTGPDPRVGLVFQEPRLLPWRTSVDNVAFPLEVATGPLPPLATVHCTGAAIDEVATRAVAPVRTAVDVNLRTKSRMRIPFSRSRDSESG